MNDRTQYPNSILYCTTYRCSQHQNSISRKTLKVSIVYSNDLILFFITSLYTMRRLSKKQAVSFPDEVIRARNMTKRSDCALLPVNHVNTCTLFLVCIAPLTLSDIDSPTELYIYAHNERQTDTHTPKGVYNNNNNKKKLRFSKPFDGSTLYRYVWRRIKSFIFQWQKES